jgi:Mn2+/Fe2+ NRAMP family transporter
MGCVHPTMRACSASSRDETAARLVHALAAAPFLVIVMVIASDHSIMGEYKNGRLARVLGWVTVSVMAAGAIALIALVAV